MTENTETVTTQPEEQKSEVTTTSNQIDISQFAAVELRVGKILDGEPVPKSKKLLKFSIDLGPLGIRQILSGIAQYYSVDDLKGKHVVIVANLKPAQMMGIESQGMLLATQSEDKESLHVIEIPSTFAPGSLVR